MPHPPFHIAERIKDSHADRPRRRKNSRANRCHPGAALKKGRLVPGLATVVTACANGNGRVGSVLAAGSGCWCCLRPTFSCLFVAKAALALVRVFPCASVAKNPDRLPQQGWPQAAVVRIAKQESDRHGVRVCLHCDFCEGVVMTVTNGLVTGAGR